MNDEEQRMRAQLIEGKEDGSEIVLLHREVFSS
jgi:hypothetical protein